MRPAQKRSLNPENNTHTHTHTSIATPCATHSPMMGDQPERQHYKDEKHTAVCIGHNLIWEQF